VVVSQITVDTNLCVKDGACAAVCPSGTLVVDEAGFPEEVPESNCSLCGHCVAVCAYEALIHRGLKEPFLLALKDLPAPELIDSFLSRPSTATRW
jgi:ferredoxin